jgi:hypothetical protein
MYTKVCSFPKTMASCADELMACKVILLIITLMSIASYALVSKEIQVVDAAMLEKGFSCRHFSRHI